MRKMPRWWFGVGGVLAVTFALGAAMQFAEKGYVHAAGVVRLAPGLANKASGIRTLFLVVFDEDNPVPLPYGAQKVELTTIPQGRFHRFTLTEANLQVMRQGSPKPQNIRLKARLDRSGTAGSDQPGDLIGEVRGIKAGSHGLEILIDTSVPLSAVAAPPMGPTPQ